MTSSGRTTRTGLLFVLPWLIGLGLFIAYPFLSGLYFSFCDYPPLKGPMFIGLDNYVELAHDTQFHRSLGVTMLFAGAAIPLGVTAALTLAVLLNARIRGQSFYRVIFYLPHLVPTVVVAILWMWLFNPEIGLLNMVLGRVLGLLDHWTSLWFDLPAAVGGHAFLTIRTGWLLAIASAGAMVFAPGVRRLWQGRAALLGGAVKLLAVVDLVLAALATLNVVLFRLMPHDMTKLRSPSWLSDGTSFPSIPHAPSWALWALIIMGLWGVGQMALIYLAKLQDVPIELYEAAEIDGASWWQKTWRITLPMISPVILFNVVMAIIGVFQVFAEPYIMTQGGPEGKTRFVAMFVYENAFQYQRLGYASAVAWVMFVIIVVLTLLTFRISRRHVYYAGR